MEKEARKGTQRLNKQSHCLLFHCNPWRYLFASVSNRCVAGAASTKAWLPSQKHVNSTSITQFTWRKLEYRVFPLPRNLVSKPDHPVRDTDNKHWFVVEAIHKKEQKPAGHSVHKRDVQWELHVISTFKSGLFALELLKDARCTSTKMEYVQSVSFMCQ